MAKFYRPKYFRGFEVVPQPIWKIYKENSFFFVRPNILQTADKLREIFGIAYINDWYYGGKNDSRGYRLFDDPDGAPLSEHKRGNALDIVFRDYEADEVRGYIMTHQDEFPYIKRLEIGIDWVHYDGLEMSESGIYLFRGGK